MEEKRIRVLYVIDEIQSFEGGGTERQLLQTIRVVQHGGFEPHLCVLRGTEWLTEGQAGCFVHHFHMARVYSPVSFSEMWRLERLIRRHQFQIIQTFFRDGNLVGPVVARLAGAKVILGSRRSLNHWMSPSFAWFQGVANRLTTRLIANSNAVKDMVVRMEGADPSKVEVIYSGIDTGPYVLGSGGRDRVRSQLGVGNADLLVGQISTLRKVKGPEDFVEAAASVAGRSSNTHFLLVGDGPLRDTLQEQIRRLDLNSRFHMVGRQADVIPFLHACDIAVLASESEGFSNALLEYMAAGLPCVVTDVGGNREALGETGVFVPPQCPDALAGAILELGESAERRAALGLAARDRVSCLFSLEQAERSLCGLYHNLLQG